MSPGTTWRAGIVTSPPSRSTRATGAAMLRNASSARPARYSWTNPSNTAKSTMIVMTTASSVWPRKPDTMGAGEQDQDQDVLELRDEDAPGRVAATRLQLVGPVLFEPLARVRARESARRRGQRDDRFGDRERVPTMRHGKRNRREPSHRELPLVRRSRLFLWNLAESCARPRRFDDSAARHSGPAWLLPFWINRSMAAKAEGANCSIL